MPRAWLLLLLGWGSILSGRDLHFAVLISANAEWRPVREANPRSHIIASPYGEYFFAQSGGETVLFFHGGWGKTAAAGSTQFVIDRFKPRYLINLGTCAGVEGRVRRFEVVAAERAEAQAIW